MPRSNCVMNWGGAEKKEKVRKAFTLLLQSRPGQGEKKRKEGRKGPSDFFLLLSVKRGRAWGTTLGKSNEGKKEKGSNTIFFTCRKRERGRRGEGGTYLFLFARAEIREY